MYALVGGERERESEGEKKRNNGRAREKVEKIPRRFDRSTVKKWKGSARRTFIYELFVSPNFPKRDLLETSSSCKRVASSSRLRDWSSSNSLFHSRP